MKNEWLICMDIVKMIKEKKNIWEKLEGWFLLEIWIIFLKKNFNVCVFVFFLGCVVFWLCVLGFEC